MIVVNRTIKDSVQLIHFNPHLGARLYSIELLVNNV